MTQPKSLARSTSGFSLVELLAVIGLLSVLIALLLPAMSKARRHAFQVACLSNLRQLGGALIAYASANNGAFPAPAVAQSEQAEDWVHWQPARWGSPVSPDRDESNSTLGRFLGNDLRVLKCPLGLPERPPNMVDFGRLYPPYPFSYSVNILFTGYSSGGHFRPNNWQPACRLSAVIAPSQKILAIEEDHTKINDGGWWALGTEYPSRGTSSVSVWHDRGREFGNYEIELSMYWVRGRGNVVFADGHGEFFYRCYTSYGDFTDPRKTPVDVPAAPEVR